MTKPDSHHFRLRVPDVLKAEIEASAAANNRSMNAEIIARLEVNALANIVKVAMREVLEERRNEQA